METEFNKVLRLFFNRIVSTTNALVDASNIDASIATYDFAAGEAMALNTLCYLDTTGKMSKADASVQTTSNTLLGVSNAALAADEVGTFYLRGLITTSGLTAGDVLYVSPTAGEWQNTVPTGSSEIVRVLGYSVSSTLFFLNPDTTWLELAV